MIISIKHHTIVSSSDSIPLDPKEKLPKTYIRSLISGGVIPWYWNLERKEFIIPSIVFDRMTISASLTDQFADSVRLNVFKEDIPSFLSSLEQSCREEIFSELLFRGYMNNRESLNWFLLKGAFLRAEGRIAGAGGQLINLSWLGKKLHPLPDLSDFYKTIVDKIPLPIFYKDTNRVYRYHNAAFNKVLKLAPPQVNGKTVFDIEPSSLAAICDQADRELMENPRHQTYESLVRYGDGSFRNIVFYKSPVLTPEGGVKGLAGIMMDMSEMKREVEKTQTLLKMKDLALRIHQAILNISDLKTILEILLTEVKDIIPKADYGAILLLDEKGYLNMETSFGYVIDKDHPFSLRYEDSFLWKNNPSSREEPIIIPDLTIFESDDIIPPPILPTIEGLSVLSSMSLPIWNGDKFFGILSLDSYKKNNFNESDLEMIRRLQEQIVILLNNQNTFQDLLHQSQVIP